MTEGIRRLIRRIFKSRWRIREARHGCRGRFGVDVLNEMDSYPVKPGLKQNKKTGTERGCTDFFFSL